MPTFYRMPGVFRRTLSRQTKQLLIIVVFHYKIVNLPIALKLSIFFEYFSLARIGKGCGSLVVKVSDYGRHVMISSPVPLKTRRVGQRYTLNLSRAKTSSSRCGVVVRRGGASSGVIHVT
ncbi:hypothetical protein TNCV_2263901 [Trichonephila clavipes]|nr:hypothetical protein TNCV_2263901 [Trichonephila clavipes]